MRTKRKDTCYQLFTLEHEDSSIYLDDNNNIDGQERVRDSTIYEKPYL